jgi:hypothetical protein
LLLAVALAYEKNIDTGDKTEFLAAYRSLNEFRQANLDYDKQFFAGLNGDERIWEKASR